MKKFLLIAAVAMTVFFTSCTKDEPDSSVNLAEELCSMLNQPVDQALETAKSLGYTAISKGKVDEYVCYKDTSDIDNFINLMFNDKNENRVVNVTYIQSGTASEAVSQAKTLTEQTGESRIVNDVTVTFAVGEVDEEDCTSYSQFVGKVGNTKEEVEAVWYGPAPSYSPIVMLAVDVQGQVGSTIYSVSFGG